MRSASHSPVGMRIAGVLAAIVVSVGLSACTATGPDTGDDFVDAEARALTTTEAQTLATMRLRNDEAGTRAVAFDVTEQGDDISLRGWYDWRTGVGYGRLGGDADQLMLWNEQVAGSHPPLDDASGDDDDPEPPPLPVPDTDDLAMAWSGGALDPAGSPLHAMLTTIAALGADRPENPLLLQQSGALWLGERTVDGTKLTVYAGPPTDEALEPGEEADPADATIRYWVDDDGLLHRMDVRLGAGAAWTPVTFGPADDVDLGDPFGIAHTGAPSPSPEGEGDG